MARKIVVEYGWLLDTMNCLVEYRRYAATMSTELGRGFHPTGKNGHSIETIIGVLRHTLAVKDDNFCSFHGEPIPCYECRAIEARAKQID